MASGRLIDYLGTGTTGERPVSLDLTVGALGLWWSTDDLELTVWDGTAWESLSSGGSGGLVSVVAGDGILVDVTDPENPEVSLDEDYAKSVVLTYAENVQTGNYTLQLTDAFKLVTIDSASAADLTVPPSSSVAFPLGTRVDIGQDGAGQVTVVGGSGVTIRSPESLKLRKQWAKATLIKRDTDTWDLEGNLEAAP